VRKLTQALSLAFVVSLAGCYAQDYQRPNMQPDDAIDAPRPSGSVAELKAHGSEDGEVLLADLAVANSLEIKIDKVTGRRILENEVNQVVVAPGTRSVRINGVDCPLLGEIRWKNGAIYLPGDARVVFADKIQRRAIPDLYAQLDDPNFKYQSLLFPTASRPKAPKQGMIAIDPHAPTLPASWNQNANREWTYIVIHHSATNEGGAASFNRAHAKKWENGLGYHFVIGNGTETRDGEIEVGSRWLRQNEGIHGAHAGVEKYNKHGIGICLVGDFEGKQPTPKQLAALRNLCRHLMNRYGVTRDHILPHREVKVGHTECPGKSFPFDAFLRSL
jgi:hypothetical protein